MRKIEILPFAPARMDLEGVMKSKVNQTKKDKCCNVESENKYIKLIETVEK